MYSTKSASRVSLPFEPTPPRFSVRNSLIFLYTRDKLADRYALSLHLRHDIEDQDGRENSAVGIEEITEIIMSGEFSSEYAIDLAELQGGIRTAYTPCVHDSAHRCEILTNSLRG